jgi:hypothetical protein
VVIESDSVDASSGAPCFSTRSALFIRGEGGFGGDRGKSSRIPRGRTRPFSTGSRGTGTRCTPTPSSPSGPGSTAPSSTASAPMDSRAGPCCTRCAAPIPPVSSPCTRASRDRRCPVTP